MNWSEHGGAAFPIPHSNEPGAYEAETGMSLRAYAAIKLRVPDSGIDWLDDMIRQAKRDDFAGQALIAVLVKMQGNAGSAEEVGEFSSKVALSISDAMLAAREAEARHD
jgi:hypothetical protein